MQQQTTGQCRFTLVVNALTRVLKALNIPAIICKPRENFFSCLQLFVGRNHLIFIGYFLFTMPLATINA